MVSLGNSTGFQGDILNVSSSFDYRIDFRDETSIPLYSTRQELALQGVAAENQSRSVKSPSFSEPGLGSLFIFARAPRGKSSPIGAIPCDIQVDGLVLDTRPFQEKSSEQGWIAVCLECPEGQHWLRFKDARYNTRFQPFVICAGMQTQLFMWLPYDHNFSREFHRAHLAMRPQALGFNLNDIESYHTLISLRFALVAQTCNEDFDFPGQLDSSFADPIARLIVTYIRVYEDWSKRRSYWAPAFIRRAVQELSLSFAEVSDTQLLEKVCYPRKNIVLNSHPIFDRSALIQDIYQVSQECSLPFEKKFGGWGLLQGVMERTAP